MFEYPRGDWWGGKNFPPATSRTKKRTTGLPPPYDLIAFWALVTALLWLLVGWKVALGIGAGVPAWICFMGVLVKCSSVSADDLEGI